MSSIHILCLSLQRKQPLTSGRQLTTSRALAGGDSCTVPWGLRSFLTPDSPSRKERWGLELTRDAQADGRARLVLAVPLVDGLCVVRPLVPRCRRQDHQLIVQCDGSASEKGQRQGHAEEPLTHKTHQRTRPAVKECPGGF